MELKWSRRREGSPVLQQWLVGASVSEPSLRLEPQRLVSGSTWTAVAGVVAGRSPMLEAEVDRGPGEAVAGGAGPGGLAGNSSLGPGNEDKVNDLWGRCLVANVIDCVGFQLVGASLGGNVPASLRATMPFGTHAGPISACRPIVVSPQSASGKSKRFFFPFTIELKLFRHMLLSPVLQRVVVKDMSVMLPVPNRARGRQQQRC